jgi:DNA-binding NarL/FixJ family response regulator
MIRIFIADDHTIMREGLKRILAEAKDVEVIAEAENGEQTLAHAAKGNFDLLLLDLSMPGSNGIELITKIRSRNPDLAILVLTMYEEEQYAVRTLRAGANGYLTKESAGTQLLTAIRKVAQGRPYISVEVAEQLAMNVMPSKERLPHTDFSKREFEVFNHLVTGKPINDIAKAMHLSAKTVSTYKVRILYKMELNSVAEMVQYAVSHRLLLPRI